MSLLGRLVNDFCYFRLVVSAWNNLKEEKYPLENISCYLFDRRSKINCCQVKLFRHWHQFVIEIDQTSNVLFHMLKDTLQRIVGVIH